MVKRRFDITRQMVEGILKDHKVNAVLHAQTQRRTLRR
jgi:hypothetical protein